VAREQRKLAAILAADVVGYSRLMGRDESGTLALVAAISHTALANARRARFTRRR
jgi:class 3 adenylate cyclase